jgi:hypothetical protein
LYAYWLCLENSPSKAHYGQELSAVMKGMVLVGEVATLAREIEMDRKAYTGLSSSAGPSMASGLSSSGWDSKDVRDFVNQEADAAAEEAANEAGPKTVNAAEAATAFMKSQTTPAPPSPGGGMSLQGSVHSSAVVDEEFTESEHVAISELLDAWEEPTRAEEEEERKITLGAIMQFRQGEKN